MMPMMIMTADKNELDSQHGKSQNGNVNDIVERQCSSCHSQTAKTLV